MAKIQKLYHVDKVEEVVDAWSIKERTFVNKVEVFKFFEGLFNEKRMYQRVYATLEKTVRNNGLGRETLSK